MYDKFCYSVQGTTSEKKSQENQDLTVTEVTAYIL